MTQIRRVPDGGARFQIFLSKEGGGISGTVTGGGPEPVSFSSLSRMVLVLEERMDLWQDASALGAGTPDVELDVFFRQNYSWQGRFRLAGEQRFTAFHSVLELLILLEAALER